MDYLHIYENIYILYKNKKCHTNFTQLKAKNNIIVFFSPYKSLKYHIGINVIPLISIPSKDPLITYL